MRKQVSINIVGMAKTGKSTIARLIRDTLHDYGFNVDLSDPDRQTDEIYARALGAVKGHDVQIHINSANIHRSAISE
jgi:adenylylsulfate kinase-like enzyme